jgi:alkylhydroperoxidase family enzyme
MARIPLVDRATAPPAVQAVYADFEALGFPILNVFRLFAANPTALEGFALIAKALYGGGSPLVPRYRELAYLRASQINSCHY